MELTNPINNEDMVEGLNRIIRLSTKMCADCEHIKHKVDEEEEMYDTLCALEHMHGRHIEMLSDSVRYLGGSPFAGDSDPSMLDFKKRASSITDLCQQEHDLISHCDEENKRLAGSDEVIEKLNRIKDDICEHLVKLQN